MLERLTKAARSLGMPSCVMTFEPHPREFFAPDQAPTRLTSLREKLELLALAGVERVQICRFNFDFARTTAEDRVRAARALRRFPLLRAAYASGRIGREVTLLVLRIVGDGPVSRKTEAAWLARAEEATVKRLRDEARALGRRRFLESGVEANDTRPEPAESSAAPPRPLADAEWHASLRREPGTARERLLRFGALALAWSGAAAGRSGPDAARLPSPDVFLRLRLPHDLADDLLSVIESTRRRLADEVERVPWDEPWPDAQARPSILAARTFSTRSRRVPAWACLLALLEDFEIIDHLKSNQPDLYQSMRKAVRGKRTKH